MMNNRLKDDQYRLKPWPTVTNFLAHVAAAEINDPVRSTVLAYKPANTCLLSL